MVYKNLLSILYEKDEIFLQDIIFNKNEKSLIGKFLIQNKSYSKKPVNYVTAENFVRCFSQSAYTLAYLLTKENILPESILNLNEKLFKKKMENLEMFYKDIHIGFHKKVTREESFEIKIVLENFKSIREFEIFYFKVKSGPVDGNMKLVVKSA